MPPLPRFVFFLLVILCLGSATAAAAGLRGSVVDPDGRPVPRARVTLAGPLGVAAATTTNDAGVYELNGLASGVYELRVVSPGLRAEPLAVTLDANVPLEIDVKLALSAVSENIVVSAAHVDVPATQTADSVTVITAADLAARGIDTVGEALRGVPGLTVIRSGGHGALTSLFPRGGDSNFTLVLVDGVRLNAFGGGFDFADLATADVERIEVVRGAQSSLFGADAIGAVVQIVTRRGGVPYLDGLVEAGNFGTTNARAASAGSWREWTWGAAAERFASDGFTGIAPASGERVSNDDYRRSSATFGGGWRSASTELRGTFRRSSSERGAPGPFGSDPGGTFSGVDRVSRSDIDTTTSSFDASHVWSRIRQRGQISFADLDSGFVSAFGPSHAETRRVTGRLQTDIILSSAIGVSTGLEVNGERALNTFVTGASFEPVPVRRRIVGFFGESRANAGEHLHVTAGVRVEHIRRDALEGDPNAFPPRPDFEADSVTSVNPKLAVGYFLQSPGQRSNRWTRLRLSAGTGIRPPDTFELGFTDNPALEPERSRSLSFGVEQAMMGASLVFDAAAFFNWYDELIVAVGGTLQGASQFRTDNISNARARGLETSITSRIRGGLESRATYTWMDTEILAVDRVAGQAPPPYEVGDPLIRRPRHQGKIEALLTRGPVAIHGALTMRGAVLDIDPSLGDFGGLYPADGYAFVDAGGMVRVRRWLEVFVRGRNLFDHEYEEALGFPALGRNAMVGFRIAASR